MPKKISVAIVGSGVMGGIHGKIAQQSGAASVDYVVDADLAKAQKCADLHRATALRSMTASSSAARSGRASWRAERLTLMRSGASTGSLPGAVA